MLELHEVMGVLVNLIVIISQHVCILNHHIVHPKCTHILFVLSKPGEKYVEIMLALKLYVSSKCLNTWKL